MTYRELIQFSPLGDALRPQDANSNERIQCVVADHLTPKTPAQAARVEEHLTRFAKFHGTMQERMSEFVATFPIHPDSIELLGRIPLPAKRTVLGILEKALQEILDRPVSANAPGLISADSFWGNLRADPEFQSVPEIEVVLNASAGLERRIEKSFPRPEHKETALRLLHTLSLHRLTAGDIYNKRGITAAALRDLLALSYPDVEHAEGDPRDHLSAHVAGVLREIQEIDRDHCLSFDPETKECYLHPARFKRFVRPEVMLHWVNAVPFLMLMATGAIILASRFWRVDPSWFQVTVIVHLSFAGFWLIGLPLVVVLGFEVHWKHIRAMLGWKKEDVIWLVQSVRGLLNRKALLSPVGRFNAGQKINACLVMLYFLGFVTTGLLMFWKGSILFPWYIHAALFFAATASVGGHLFLSLINPGTRKSLPGIFTGWAPIDYIEHHHPLSLPPSLRSHLEPPSARAIWEELSLARAELLILATVFIMAGLGVVAFQRGQIDIIKKSFAGSFTGLITPNQLSTKHRIGPTAESCVKCHSYVGEIPDANCEQCHADIKKRRTLVLGYHGTLKGECKDCHREHPTTATNSLVPLQPEKFDHNLAAFKLLDKHAKVQCDECHKKRHPPKIEGVSAGIYFTGVPYDSCTACHQDPHAGQLAAACEKCHTAAGWTGKNLMFVHDTDSTYPLTDKHKTVECIKCHQPKIAGAALGTAPLKGVSRECAGCHKDPHSGQLVAACATCHSPAGWMKEQLTFDHNKASKFPLLAKHVEVACDKCHKPGTPGQKLGLANFRGLKMECVDCHKDTHNGQLALACQKCHSAAGWTGKNLMFAHDTDSTYPLTDKHKTVECIKCHQPKIAGATLATAPFKGISHECAACHKDPHREQFVAACTTCHVTPATWVVDKKQFDHNRDSKFRLEGEHAKNPKEMCIKCHKPEVPNGTLGTAKFKGVSTACQDCHRITRPEEHPETFGPLCVSCHKATQWGKNPPELAHIQNYAPQGEKLLGKHLLVECRVCHKETKIPVLGRACKPDQQCLICHQPDDPHKGTLGLDCFRCHNTLGWKGADLRFNHNTMTRYRLDQDHEHVACVKCHVNNVWKPVETTCKGCHPKKF